MKFKKILKKAFGTMIGMFLLGFVRGNCAVCNGSSFLDNYFLKTDRAISDVNSELRQAYLYSWERSRSEEMILFPLKYSFFKLMGVVGGWNAYLGSSKVVFRDLKGFDQIEESVKSVEFAIFGTNIFWNKVPDKFLKRFLSSYQILGVARIDKMLSSANWEDLLNALWAINFINKYYRAKSALGDGYNPIWSGEDLINFFNRALGGKIKLSLDKDHLSQLQNEYECFAKEYGICEKAQKNQNVYKRIKNIVENFSNKGSQSVEKFSASFNKLKEALQKFSSSGGFWNKNWMKVSANMKVDGDSLVDYNVMAGKQFGISGAEVASKVLEDTQLEKIFGETRVENMPNSLDLTRVIYLSGYGIQDSIKKDEKEKLVSIQQALERLDFVLKKTIAQDVAMGASWEPRVYTVKIVNVSQQIHKILDIIGSEDKENSLVWLLGSACELQCGNLGGKCWAD